MDMKCPEDTIQLSWLHFYRTVSRQQIDCGLNLKGSFTKEMIHKWNCL